MDCASAAGRVWLIISVPQQSPGPTTSPAGALVVPAGANKGMNWNQPGATFWFAPGVHTFGESPFGQISPGDSTTFIGAPGAILDGQNRNLYAFTQHARGVTIRYLEIRNFGTGTSNNDEGVVNHDSGENVQRMSGSSSTVHRVLRQTRFTWMASCWLMQAPTASAFDASAPSRSACSGQRCTGNVGRAT